MTKATVTGPPSGVIRNKPIMPRLKTILSDAADAAGIDHVRISSGGQDAKGHGTRRTGSTRHDLGGAADLELLIDGRVLNFMEAADVPTISRFVTECSRHGATGIGAGHPGYMGPTKLHVGFGAPAVWGAGGKSANAPAWLRAAVAAASHAAPVSDELKLGASGPEVVKLQQALATHGNSIHLIVDGSFGPATESAVKAYQSAHGLVADGVVGPATRSSLGL